MAMGTPHRSANKSRDNHGIFDGKPHSPLAPHSQNNHLPTFFHPTRVDCIKICHLLHWQQKFSHLPCSMRNPTRISPPTSIDTIINLPDNDDDDFNPAKKGMLHPTNLKRNAAILLPLPHLDFRADFDYWSELTAITTACKRLEQQWPMAELHLPLLTSSMTNMAPSDPVILVATQ